VIVFFKCIYLYTPLNYEYTLLWLFSVLIDVGNIQVKAVVIKNLKMFKLVSSLTQTHSLTHY